MEIILIPLDNRPVTYAFPQMIANVAGVRTVVPPRQIMGSLNNDSNLDALNTWLSGALGKNAAEALLACSDSIIYGGLISSRRSTTTSAQLLERTKPIARWKKEHRTLSKVFLQSSIMRISDNYDNTEEKAYWSRYGKEIFEWSETLHRLSAAASETHQKQNSSKLQQLESRIDAAVRDDYLNTRRRNFAINRKLLEYAESGAVDLLIYSQDDSAQYGLNVLEKERLLSEAAQRKLTNVIAYAGADEVLMTMIARWLLTRANRAPSIKVSFSPGNGGEILSRYEGQTLGESVKNQLAAAGLPAPSASGAADLHFIIHTAADRQGDHIWLPGQPDMRQLNTSNSVNSTIELMQKSEAPVVLCDLAYANGADPALIDKMLEQPALFTKLWGFGGWNTSGNTLGSAISTAVARWFAAQVVPHPNAQTALSEALYVRLADDWVYQANVRKQLGNELSNDRLRTLMESYLRRIEAALNFKPRAVELRLPWQRSFEVEVRLADPIQAAR